MNEYQWRAATTAFYPREHNIVYPALKLNGEAGEVAEKVGKVLRDNGGDFTDEKRWEIAAELGDVLWYVAALAADLQFTLDEIADLNLEKLKSRQVRGVLGGNGDQR